MLKQSIVFALFGALTFAISASPAQELDARVRRNLDSTSLNYRTTDSGRFRLLMQTTKSRTQLVFINSRTSTFQTLNVRQVWSIGYSSEAPLPQDVMRSLLRHSAQVKLGGWEMESSAEKSIAVFRIQIPADADAATLATAIKGAADAADEMERRLVGTDKL